MQLEFPCALWTAGCQINQDGSFWVYLLPCSCPRLIQYAYAASLTYASALLPCCRGYWCVRGPQSDLLHEIFRKPVLKNNYSAHLSSILLNHQNRLETPGSPLRHCSEQQDIIFKYGYLFSCHKSRRNPQVMCVETVRGLKICLGCVGLGGCVVLEKHPSSP